jgi:hypothetical protein
MKHKLTRKELKQLLKEDPTLDRVRYALEGKCNVYQFKTK